MSIKITVEPSGHVFELDEGETILDAALRNGLPFPYGCRNGGCGACKGKVVSGDVAYPGGHPPCITEMEEVIGQVVMCQAVPTTDLVVEVHEVTRAQEVAIKQFSAKVAQKERLADDVVRLLLTLDNAERMRFLAGQYIDILLSDGRRRSFSIANAPHDDDFIELHVRLVKDGQFTHYVFDALSEGTTLDIEGPLGGFYLREESSRPILFVAGGTGFAPIKGLIEHALQEQTERKMQLYWGSDNEAGQYLSDLVKGWDKVDYVPVLSGENHTSGRRGFVHQAVLEDYTDLSGFDVYVSGPPAMVSAARDAFSQCGLPAEQFYFDSFDFAIDP